MTGRGNSVSLWLARNQLWFAPVSSAATAATAGTYIALFAEDLASVRSQPRTKGQAPALLEAAGLQGWLNLLPCIALILIVIQVTASISRSRRETEVRRAERQALQVERKRLVAELLTLGQRVLASRTHQARNVQIRGLVTLHVPAEKARRTVAGINIAADPEVYLSVPEDFGATGESFTRGKVVHRDITPDHYTRYPPELAELIWRDIRSIVSAPLRYTTGVAFGTLSFDSNASLNATKFDDRNVHMMMAELATILSSVFENDPDLLRHELLIV